MARVSLAGLELGSFVRQATAKYDARDPDAAIAMLRQAVDLAELVPTDNPHVLRQAYQAYYNLAEYYFETKRADEASRYCEKAVELSDALQKADSSDLLFMRLGSYSHRLSGRVCYAAGKWAEALLHFETMLAAREVLAEREPGVTHRRHEVASAHNWIGRTARKSNQLDKAVKHDKAACMIFASLLYSEPGMVDYAMRLTYAEVHLASDYMLYKTSDANEIALEIFTRARNRVTKGLDATPPQQDRIIAIVSAIDKNVETLDRRNAPESQ